MPVLLLLLRVFVAAVGPIGFMMGAAFLYMHWSDPTGGLPAYEELTELSGQISWVSEYKYGVRFGLAGNPDKLVYSSRQRAVGLVERSLTMAKERTVVVLASLTDPVGPIFGDTVYYRVLEIRVDGKTVRSYEESAVAWLSNQRLMPYLGAFLVVGGLIMVRKKLQERRRFASRREP
ncbi:MAG: hypothetical protein AAFN78_07700 [Pseudomonadota bacterium]